MYLGSDSRQRGQTSPTYLWSDSGAGHISGEIPESLWECFPFKPESIYPRNDSRAGLPCVRWERVPSHGRRPGPRTTRAPTQKPSREKLNTALVLLCWSVSSLFCRVSFLVGAPCLWVLVCGCLLWGFHGAFFPKEGRRPQNLSRLAGIPWASYDCGTTRQPSHAVLGTKSSLFTSGVTLEQYLEVRNTPPFLHCLSWQLPQRCYSMRRSFRRAATLGHFRDNCRSQMFQSRSSVNQQRPPDRCVPDVLRAQKYKNQSAFGELLLYFFEGIGTQVTDIFAQ